MRKNTVVHSPPILTGEPKDITQAMDFILENDYFGGRYIELDVWLRL